jgi:uncharacterized protein with von Willebrand factor type A (vWA) domain
MAPADPLTELRDRVHAAQAAAERLAAEARSQSRELPRENELEALVGLLRALRELVPPERQQQVSDLLRHVLLLLRAIIDFWVERLEPPPARRVEVQDIPID